jgi:two-component system, LuxR family, sensor kinase FixL
MASHVHKAVKIGRNADATSRATDCTSCELRASEERYRNLIQYLPTALWQVDSRRMAAIFDRLKADGVRDIAAYLDQHPDLIKLAGDVVCVTDVNRDAISLFRANNAADLIKPIQYLFVAARGLAKRVMAAHFEGRRNFIEETRILAFDGTMIDVLFTVTYPRPPEQLDTTFVTIQDISERLNAEQQLRKLQADFTHAGRIATLGELAASIAHEINQPLAAIAMNGETSLRWLARTDQNIEKVTELTSRIVSNARRASEIIHRIRGMAAKQEPEKRRIDLNEVVEEALLFIRHDVDAKLITLSTTFRPGLPRVMGDRIQLQQVIINLLVNSIQAITLSGQPTRRIDIQTAIDEDGSAVFSVFDNGPGIADADLAHIFDSFFSTKDAGIGIGLGICQSIIAAHGGSISGSNRPNGGAHFRFTLPAPTVVGTDPGIGDFMPQTGQSNS